MNELKVKAQKLFAHLHAEPVKLSEALEDTGINGHMMRLISRIDSPMPSMSDEVADWLDDYYRADNEALSHLIDINLSDYGYIS